MEENSNESQMTMLRDNTTISDDEEIEDSLGKRYFTIEVEFDKEEELGDDKYSSVVLHLMKELLKAWIKENIIDELDMSKLNS